MIATALRDNINKPEHVRYHPIHEGITELDADFLVHHKQTLNAKLARAVRSYTTFQVQSCTQWCESGSGTITRGNADTGVEFDEGDKLTLPESLLTSSVPDLELDSFATSVDHLWAELHANRVVRVLLDYERTGTVSKQEREGRITTNVLMRCVNWKKKRRWNCSNGILVHCTIAQVRIEDQKSKLMSTTIALHFPSMNWWRMQDFPTPALPITRNLNRKSGREEPHPSKRNRSVNGDPKTDTHQGWLARRQASTLFLGHVLSVP